MHAQSTDEFIVLPSIYRGARGAIPRTGYVLNPERGMC